MKGGKLIARLTTFREGNRFSIAGKSIVALEDHSTDGVTKTLVVYTMPITLKGELPRTVMVVSPQEVKESFDYIEEIWENSLREVRPEAN